jgi:hypothetical protein
MQARGGRHAPQRDAAEQRSQTGQAPRPAMVCAGARAGAQAEARAPRHLVGQDAVDAVVVQVDEPVQALQLVLAHRAALDNARLRAQAVTAQLAVGRLVREQLAVLLLLRVLGAVPPAAPASGLRKIVSAHPCSSFMPPAAPASDIERYQCGPSGAVPPAAPAGGEESVSSGHLQQLHVMWRVLHPFSQLERPALVAAYAVARPTAPATSFTPRNHHLDGSSPDTRALLVQSALCPGRRAQPERAGRGRERGRAGGRALLLLLVRGDRRKVLEHLRLLQQELQPLAPALRLRAPHTAGGCRACPQDLAHPGIHPTGSTSRRSAGLTSRRTRSWKPSPRDSSLRAPRAALGRLPPST